MKTISIIILIFLSQMVNAQNECFDIQDTTINEESLALDIDNNGEPDFLLYYFFETGGSGTGDSRWGYNIVPYDSNAVLSNGYGSTVTKTFTDTICETDNDWMTYFAYPSYWITLLYPSNSSLNIRPDGFEDLFVGIRLKIDNNYYYGWIQLSNTTASNITVKAYCYNTIPDECIVIKKLIINSIFNPDNSMINIYPNPSKEYFTVELLNNFDAQIKIVDITGRIVYRNNFNKKTRIGTESFNKGVYTVIIENKGKTETEKIIVK